MNDEHRLREKVWDRMQAGDLPARKPDRVWGGPGVGARCAVCGLPVTEQEVEMELEFTGSGSNAGSTRHHLHVRCYAALELECQKLRADGARDGADGETRFPAGTVSGGAAGSQALHKEA